MAAVLLGSRPIKLRKPARKPRPRPDCVAGGKSELARPDGDLRRAGGRGEGVGTGKGKGARRAVMLPVSAPFHCALMQPAQEEVARVLGALKLADPRIPVAANVTGGWSQPPLRRRTR